MDLTALAVVSIELFASDGTAIHVSDPIHVSVPLPSDTHNRMATSVPTWLYQPKTGSFDIILYSYIDHWQYCAVMLMTFKYHCRPVGQKWNRIHQKGRDTFCMGHCCSPNGILVGCFSLVIRYSTLIKPFSFCCACL